MATVFIPEPFRESVPWSLLWKCVWKTVKTQICINKCPLMEQLKVSMTLGTFAKALQFNERGQKGGPKEHAHRTSERFTCILTAGKKCWRMHYIRLCIHIFPEYFQHSLVLLEEEKTCKLRKHATKNPPINKVHKQSNGRKQMMSP